MTERLSLRVPEHADLDQWFERIYCDPEVTRYLPGGRPFPREQVEGADQRARAHWDERGYGLWLVWDRETGVLIGHCGLRFLDDMGETGVLYALSRDRWGQGIATEAATAALRFGLEDIGLERVIGLAAPQNIASRRVMEHLGMRFERETDAFGMHLVQYGIERSLDSPL